MTREDFESGPPVRLSVLVQLTGWSRHKLYADADRGRLVVSWEKCGTRKYARVERADVLRYLAAIDFRWPKVG